MVKRSIGVTNPLMSLYCPIMIGGVGGGWTRKRTIPPIGSADPICQSTPERLDACPHVDSEMGKIKLLSHASLKKEAVS
jgi:hypothetical protein